MNRPASNLPNQLNTLVDLLQWRSVSNADQLAYRFLKDGEADEVSITYRELDQQARAIAVLLQALGAQGQRVLLLYPAGLEYIAAFWGCLYAGAIAIPVYPPRPNRSLIRLEAIIADADAAIALTLSAILTNLQQRFVDHAVLKSLRWLTTDQLDIHLADRWLMPDLTAQTLALLQYTSGSTASPKGVMITHDNLLHNSALIQKCFEDTAHSGGVSWLPPYHDMGLIGGILQPLYVGAPMTLMSPVAFLQKPFRWLAAIARYQATTSGGPNFAYELCVRKITPEQRQQLDLSQWSLAFSGAEPIHFETLQAFAAAFAPQGFRWQSFCPCYGMAETTLLVTAGDRHQALSTYCVDRQQLRHNRVVAVMPTANESKVLVGCGRSPLAQVRVVDPESQQPLSDDQVGEIWVERSSSVAQGYWQRSEETAYYFSAQLATGAATCEAESPVFLRTGDLGFLHAGELYVTGRLKDLIIIRGRNHYPQDIELTVEQAHPALRAGSGAAFAVTMAETEQLVVVQELERSALRQVDTTAVIAAIRRQISEHHELQVAAIALLKTGSIPKTSSGKIQRHACRADFLDNQLEVVATWSIEKETAPSLAELTAASAFALATAQPGADRGNVLPSAVNGRAAPSPSVPFHSPFHPAGQLAFAADEQPPSPPPSQGDVIAHAAQSQQRATDLIAWLADYANTRINSRLIDERRSIPPHIVLDLGNRGALGMQVPAAYGGLLNLTHTDMMRVMQQLGAIDPTLSLFVGLNNVLGIRPILNYAPETVRARILPLLATGRELAAFALTEPEAGSHPQAITTRAVPLGADRWQLSGTKIWSGSAAWAGVITVFAHQLDDSGRVSGMSAFAIRQGTPGLRQGPEALTMGMRGMVQNTLYLDQVEVGREHLLGELGQGMTVGQDAMMYGRLTIAASSIGGMKRCAQLMLRYARARTISTGRLLDNPVTLARLSDLTVRITAVETLIRQITTRLDQGVPLPVDAYVVCKIAGPEFLWQAADQLVQLLGGRGYIEPNLAPQILRDARILRIFEGPTETLLMFLGSRVVNKSDELVDFLVRVLQAPAIGQRLKTAAAQISERCAAAQTPFAERSAALRWAYVLTGEVALYAMLWAAVEGIGEGASAAAQQRAALWARLQFEQTLARALQGSPTEAVLLTATAMTDLVSSYAETIADVEQTLAGEDADLDSWLRRSGPQSAGAASPELSQQMPTPVAQNAAVDRGDAFMAKDTSVQSGSDKTALEVQTWIVDWLVRELKLPTQSIDVSKAFADYGLDSVTAVELADALENWLGQPLSPTLAYEYPTIEALAHFLAMPAGMVKDGAEEYSAEADTSIPDEDTEMTLLLRELEQLSEAEAQQLLEQ